MPRPTFVVIAIACCAWAPAWAQSTKRASVDSSGLGGNGHSSVASVSADGRYVAFSSDASSLVPSDTNATIDVFVRDLATGQTTRVSVDSSGAQADGASDRPAISADGRYVAFRSTATNLVAADTNDSPDVFLHDRSTGQVVRVSVDSSGAEVDGGVDFPSLSADGRFIAFESGSDALVPGDTNGFIDVFVRDGLLGKTMRVSVDSSGAQGDGAARCHPGSISADGRFVAFESVASNLVAGDSNGVSDVFVHDAQLGVTVRASVDSAGVQGNLPSHAPALSADGLCVAFASRASNLAAGDTNGSFDVFVRDLVAGLTSRVSVDSAGSQADLDSGYPSWNSISGDGRRVAFASVATNLVAGDTNGTFDVFVHDRLLGLTSRASVESSGTQSSGDAFSPSISSDARYVAFESSAADLVPADLNGKSDVFLRDLVSAPIATFCYGDAIDPAVTTLCPCFNFGGAGRGCANALVSTGAALTASGTSSPDLLVLDASGELPSSLSIFLQGDAVDYAAALFGDGLRCADGNLLRLYTKNAVRGMVSAPSGHELSISARSAQLGDTIAPGSVRYYQTYYRDPNLAFCSGAGFNATNAVAIYW